MAGANATLPATVAGLRGQLPLFDLPGATDVNTGELGAGALHCILPPPPPAAASCRLPPALAPPSQALSHRPSHCRVHAAVGLPGKGRVGDVPMPQSQQQAA